MRIRLVGAVFSVACSFALTLGLTSTAEAADWHGCPAGYTCLYENIKWNKSKGRRIQFKDCGQTQILANWGFDNRASSWVNRTKRKVFVTGSNGRVLWTEAPNSLVEWVGADNNDKALGIEIVC